MAGELLAPTTQGDVTESVVEPQAVEALQNSVGVSGFHKQVVLTALGDWRGGRSHTDVLLYGESTVHDGRQRQPGVDSNYFSHVSPLLGNAGKLRDKKKKKQCGPLDSIKYTDFSKQEQQSEWVLRRHSQKRELKVSKS